MASKGAGRGLLWIELSNKYNIVIIPLILMDYFHSHLEIIVYVLREGVGG